MSKTAVNQLIEWLEGVMTDATEQAASFKKDGLEQSALGSEAMAMAYKICKQKAEMLSPIEYNQIKNAYREGMNDGEYPAMPGMDTIYFEKTFHNTLKNNTHD